MLDQVVCEFGHDQRDSSGIHFVQSCGKTQGPATCFAGMRLLRDVLKEVWFGCADHRHRVMVILVPLPGAESISNSLTSRFAPPRPSPRPPPLVYPSRIAKSIS